MEIPATVTELAKFYSYLSDKGLMNERTAYARAQAAQQVLSILDEEEKQDLRKLDRDAVFRRFVNKNGQRFTPDSLQTYKQRFYSALEEFLLYAKDPSAYKPPTSGTRERARSASTGAPSSAAPRGMSRSTARQTVPALPEGLLAYPLPLPSGTVAQLLLPPAITQSDAARITALVSAMVQALVTNEETV